MRSFVLFFVNVLGTVIQLKDNDWKKTMTGDWLIEFYAPWCPACKNFAPTYKDLSQYSSELNVQMADCDITNAHALSGRFLITALPTIFHCTDGVCRKYSGKRDLDTLYSYLSDETWKNEDPLAWYLQPNGFCMSAVSYLFTFSSQMQLFHEYLTQEQGVNTYAAYGLYFLMTVVTGLFLGGILVLITDFWNSSREQAAIAQQKKTDGAEVTAGGDTKEEEPQPDVIPEKARRRVRKDD